MFAILRDIRTWHDFRGLTPGRKLYFVFATLSAMVYAFFYVLSKLLWLLSELPHFLWLLIKWYFIVAFSASVIYAFVIFPILHK